MTDRVLRALEKLRQKRDWIGYGRLWLALYLRYYRVKLRLWGHAWIERWFGVTPAELQRRAERDLAALDTVVGGGKGEQHVPTTR